MAALPCAVANDTATKLLARVKELREARGLSQEAFAEKAGLGYKYYQHVEAGRRRDIRLSTLEKLATACGLPLPELLDFDRVPLALAEAQAEYDAGRPSAKPAKGKAPKPKSSKKTARF